MGAALYDRDSLTLKFFNRHQGTPLSGARPPLDKLTESIGQSLSAYVASGILNELEWAVTRAENMDVKSFQAKKGKDLWCTFSHDTTPIQRPRGYANIAFE